MRDHASSIFKDYVWVRNEDYALTMKTDKSNLALYDLKEDPKYLHNVAEGNKDIIYVDEAKIAASIPRVMPAD